MLLSRLIPRLRAFFPAEVTGFIVTMVGISLIRAATLNFVNLGNPDTEPQASHVVVACITLATMVGLNVWGKGPLRLFCALLGIAVGYAAASAAGMLTAAHLDQLVQAPLMAFPDLGHPGWSFYVALLVPFLGLPMEFATVRPAEADLLSDDQAFTRLAGFLIRHYADQIAADSRDGQCRVQFHFDH
jgi:xanthine permease XanP